MARDAVGTVIRITPRGTLLVRPPGELRVRAADGPDHGAAKNVVRIGSLLVDARNEIAGKVADVLGPVKRPYLLVLPPRGAKFHRLAGKELYLS